MKKSMVKLKLNKLIVYLIFFISIPICLYSADTKINNKSEFCDSTNPSFQDEFMCNEQKLHESMVSNPLPFVIFYAFSVLFIAFLFRISTKKNRKKGNAFRKK